MVQPLSARASGAACLGVMHVTGLDDRWQSRHPRVPARSVTHIATLGDQTCVFAS